jgi:hypothetical protein
MSNWSLALITIQRRPCRVIPEEKETMISTDSPLPRTKRRKEAEMKDENKQSGIKSVGARLVVVQRWC